MNQQRDQERKIYQTDARARDLSEKVNDSRRKDEDVPGRKRSRNSERNDTGEKKG